MKSGLHHHWNPEHSLESNERSLQESPLLKMSLQQRFAIVSSAQDKRHEWQKRAVDQQLVASAQQTARAFTLSFTMLATYDGARSMHARLARVT